jgi:hypothetical protein
VSQIESKTKTDVETSVAYLPAPKPFKKGYPEETLLETVRTDAMAHFGVQNYTDRDQHEFHLEHKGQRGDYAQTVGSLADRDDDEDKDGKDKRKRRKLGLDLVEQVTAGGR